MMLVNNVIIEQFNNYKLTYNIILMKRMEEKITQLTFFFTSEVLDLAFSYRLQYSLQQIGKDAVLYPRNLYSFYNHFTN